MTETMQQYTELMELMEYIPEFKLEDIVAYAGFASRSSYLDIDQLMDDTMNHYIRTNLYQQFVDVMDENIYYETFPEYCAENGQLEKLQMSSLMAYCVMTRLVHPTLINIIGENIRHTVSDKRTQEITLYNKIIDAINAWLADAKAQEIFEVTQELQTVTGESCYELYEMVRETLFHSLDRYFCAEKMRFSYWIGTKMREIQWKAEYPQKLKNSIMFVE